MKSTDVPFKQIHFLENYAKKMSKGRKMAAAAKAAPAVDGGQKRDGVYMRLRIVQPTLNKESEDDLVKGSVV